MVLFEPVLLRLKEQLGIASDKDVAAVLGIGEKALNARKRRSAFPEDKLLALHARRPDLNLDVAYILTGERAVVHAVMGAVKATADIVERLGGSKAERQARSDVLLAAVVAAAHPTLSDEEAVLVARYRQAPLEARDAALRALLGADLSDKKTKTTKTVVHGDVGNQMRDNKRKMKINMGSAR